MTCICISPVNSHHHLQGTTELLYPMACILCFVAPAFQQHGRLNFAGHLVTDYAGSMTDGITAGVPGGINALSSGPPADACSLQGCVVALPSPAC